MTIQFYNNSCYISFQVYGLTRNKKKFTLEVNMLNMHVDLLKYAVKWAAENI